MDTLDPRYNSKTGHWSKCSSCGHMDCKCMDYIDTPPRTMPSQEFFDLPDKAKAIPDKLRYDLIPPTAFQECAKGWTQGQAKYDDDHWKSLEPHVFVAKIMRHLQQYRLGESHDSETGVHHLACCANNAMMLCEKELTKD